MVKSGSRRAGTIKLTAIAAVLSVMAYRLMGGHPMLSGITRKVTLKCFR